MKNPCDNCVIKINCTEICWEKRNYKTLINQAIYSNRNTWSAQNPKFNIRFYMKLLKETNYDEATIKLRNSQKKGDF
jgi:hypothetical protein